MSSKGKEKEVVYGKQKVSAGRSGGGKEESRRRRRNRGVLQFFEDSAEADSSDASDDSDSDDCDLKVFDKMAMRKTEVQNVDVKDGEIMILECSRVPLARAISSDSDDQTEGPIAPMKEGSLESSVSLHDTAKVTKTFYPLSVTLPLVAKASTVVDVIASTAAKFTLHDIFQKVGITEPIRNYFIGSRNSNAVLNLVEHNKPSYWPKYLGNSQLTVTNVELSEHWTCNMNLKYGVPIGMQDRNGNLVLRGEPNWYMTVNLIQNVENYELIRDLFDPGGKSFANVTVEIYLSVHSSFLTNVRKAFGIVWCNHLQKQKGGVDFVNEIQSSVLKHMPRVTYDEVFIGCYWTLAIDIEFRIWHVYSRMVVQAGRERHSAFCLMQKFIDMKSLGTKLQIISAFSVDHVKGFFYIEADKQYDIYEACKGLTYIYASRVVPVPSNEVYHLLNVKTKRSEVSKGMWARVKNGKYKGDLAQGAGVSINRTVIPAPKLISSIDLEEFQPLIQFRRDRDTGLGFQILDGMMLKDGYLYKRVSIDSLSCWGIMPTEEELLKFSNSDDNESDDLEWLSQLYGEKKKKKTITNEKGGEKGEGSSGFGLEDGFELYNLVCFSRKDFGLIVGMEKDDRYKD
ncbi:hypothetical protein V6N11_000407 [Hibiscus sabdariffa]|uniref:Uncharacterized protein n=1 Tax=Hibiscus sabdariffa TaxID=183260 RepID=A0ABR2NSU2_9ROSI